MTLPTIQFEGRLKAIGATSTKDGNWTKVEFQVHPSDDVSDMLKAGLNSRWTVVVVQLGDDDQPIAVQSGPLKPGYPGSGAGPALGKPRSSDVSEPEKPKGGPLAKQAGILCGDERFGSWIQREGTVLIGATPDHLASFVRRHCGVQSRAELDHNPEAAEKFKALKAEFEAATPGMMAERTQ